MDVYFIRHGSTHLSDTFIHQSPNTPLSPKGVAQISGRVELFRKLNPELIISSEYTRALETARIIGGRVGLTPHTNGLFYEMERPSSLYAASLFNVKTFIYFIAMLIHRNDQKWHYQDAESFFDIVSRGQRALRYLESLAPTHGVVFVVSHTVFLHILLAYMCRNRKLSVVDLALLLFKSEHLRNGAVVHARFEAHPKGTCGWNIIGSPW